MAGDTTGYVFGDPPIYYNTKDSQLIKIMGMWQGIRLVVSVPILIVACIPSRLITMNEHAGMCTQTHTHTHRNTHTHTVTGPEGVP